MKTRRVVTTAAGKAGESPTALLADVRELIESARQTVARGVNAALVILHWQIGDRIRRDVLSEKRAEYGEEIVTTLSRQLSAEFGRGFAEKNLRRMVQLAEHSAFLQGRHPLFAGEGGDVIEGDSQIPSMA